MPKPVLYMVRSTVDRSAEGEWDKWHSQQHVPDIVREPGFLKASKYRSTASGEGPAEYWTIYELESLEAFERYDKSNAARNLRADHKAKFGQTTKTERFVLVRTFETTNPKEQ